MRSEDKNRQSRRNTSKTPLADPTVLLKNNENYKGTPINNTSQHKSLSTVAAKTKLMVCHVSERISKEDNQTRLSNKVYQTKVPILLWHRGENPPQSNTKYI